MLGNLLDAELHVLARREHVRIEVVAEDPGFHRHAISSCLAETARTWSMQDPGRHEFRWESGPRFSAPRPDATGTPTRSWRSTSTPSGSRRSTRAPAWRSVPG